MIKNLYIMNGRITLSDFHPLRRCIGSDSNYYFDKALHNAVVAYKQYFNHLPIGRLFGKS